MAKLYFNYAAMNAGKSTALLQASFNYVECGMRTMLFTAALDTRMPAGTIGSRIGLTASAIAFDDTADLLAIIESASAEERVHAVFVDEAQFLNEAQVMQLANVADELDIPVLCYGLRTDFRGELFEGSRRLLAIADEIRELKTICVCGRKATMNLRRDADGAPIRDGETVEIGGNERYVALCRKHFYEALKKAES